MKRRYFLRPINKESGDYCDHDHEVGIDVEPGMARARIMDHPRNVLLADVPMAMSVKEANILLMVLDAKLRAGVEHADLARICLTLMDRLCAARDRAVEAGVRVENLIREEGLSWDDAVRVAEGEVDNG